MTAPTPTPTPPPPLSCLLPLWPAVTQLSGAGTFDKKLTEMYGWGKQYGWEPVVLKGGVPQPPMA